MGAGSVNYSRQRKKTPAVNLHSNFVELDEGSVAWNKAEVVWLHGMCPGEPG